MLSDLIFRVRSLFQTRAAEVELDDELRFHAEQQRDKYVNSGMTPEEAARRVRLDFGGLDQVKEECREARGVQLMETLIQDVRYALRTLRKAPGFTLVALLTLGLGIGANTAIFSIVDGILLRPLPYQDPASLIAINETTPRVGTVSVSYLNFLDWRHDSRSFSDMAAVCGVGFNLAGINQPQNISGEAVSPNFLSMLGVRPLLGRDFEASEGKAGAAPVVLLTYHLWQSQFGGESGVPGRTISLDGRGFTIIGVLPPDFRSIDKADVMVPIGVWLTNRADAATERSDRGDMMVIGRLAPQVGVGQARAEMDGIAARLAQAYPGANDQFGVFLRPVREVFVSDIRPAILILFGAVMFVLLIACANVANLFLMRGAGRTKEVALRIALGASRGRIVRQMLAESFVLALLGGIFGLALAAVGIEGIGRLIPTDTLMGASVNLNGAALLFAAGAIVLSTFIFGLAPAIQSARTGVQAELKDGGRTAGGGTGQNRWRTILAIAEVSLALVLLVGAGLMMKSLYRLLAVDPGFRPERVLTMEMSLRTSQYDKDVNVLNFWQQVLDRVRTLPGVETAALGTAIPLTDNHSRTDVTIEGMALPKPGSFPHPDTHTVSAGYVQTLGVPLVRGREFTDADTENAPRVAMINTRLAREYFPKENPVGKRIMFGRPSAKNPLRWMTVVGVVGDTKLYGLANPSRLEIYVPLRQSASGHMNLIVKSNVDPAALASSIRAAVAEIDKDQPVFGISTMKQLIVDSVSTPRITLILLGLFSALALVLAAIGIYGVISYSVAQRTHEIGIRMALGAGKTDVLRMILAQGARIAGAGVAIGMVASFGLTRLLAKLLFSVSAADPLTFAAVAILLILVAMLACYIPARRTLRVDPMIALRYE
jgi:putative ABC transport system permease protein